MSERKVESDEWDKGDKEADYYEDYLESSKDNPLAQHGDGPLHKIIKPEEMPWEDSSHGRLKHVLNEHMCEDMDIPARATDIYIQEIPPGSKSGKHRHMSEELVFILEGEGYDLHWDPTSVIRDTVEWEWPDEPQRFDWEEEDVVFIPNNTAHQHHNASDEDPVRLLIIQCRAYTHFGYGFEDMEQFEVAPEYNE